MESRDESYFLLLELMQQEPTVQSCLHIVTSTCLAQGIRLQVMGRECRPGFQKFMDKYYISFCQHAIRSMFAVGFVPWRLRRLATGDPVPEVVPLGLYTWVVDSQPRYTMNTRNQNEPYAIPEDNRNNESDRGSLGHVKKRLRGDDSNKRHHSDGALDAKEYDNARDAGQDSNHGNMGKHNASLGAHRPFGARKGRYSAMYERQHSALERQAVPIDDEESKMLHYHIQFTQHCGNVLEKDIEIYEFVPATNDITLNSAMFKTVPSPFAHILVDYRNVRQTMLRRNFADAWNTRAKMVVSYTSTKNMYQINEGNPIVNDWNIPQNRVGLVSDSHLPPEMDQNAYVRDALMDTIVESKQADHKPVVYSLPKNSKLESVSPLTSIQDVAPMQEKLARDIASVMGVPYEMVSGTKSAGNGVENRTFATTMLGICKHLERLLTDVYVATYGGDCQSVVFTLRPASKLQINSVADLALLIDTGVVSVEKAVAFCNMLMGMDLQQHSQQTIKSTIEGRKAFLTPSHRKDLGMVLGGASKPTAKS